MLTDSITTKTYRLLNLTTRVLPALNHKNFELGLERLKRILSQDTHKSYGTYIRSGAVTSVLCMDGKLSRKERNNILVMIDNTTDLKECNGYYFIHGSEDEEGDEKKMDSYSHYFIGI